MKRVFIKYNPYQVSTEITIDDKPLKRNSKLNVRDQRLQEWVDELPQKLFEECSTRDFDLTFQGTVLDFEDIVAVSEEAKKKGINIKLTHIPAKEVKDKEKAIAEIFDEIQNGPFDELKQPDVIRAFELASSSDFEVNVIATMSAGKSTLINSLLGKRIMPAKKEACTATITEIKDNDIDHFEAIAYDKEGSELERHMDATYEIMDRLNSDTSVSKIRVSGNIPFVTSDDVSLILVDTPGPNNSRDPEHKATTYRMLSESSKTLVLYLMCPPVGSDDDAVLLGNVAKSMRVGGKQSRDRFIFVVNKLDDTKKGEDSVDETIEKVRLYLADHEIENPCIFPISALTALDIRTILAVSEDDDDDDDVYAAKGKVRKFNRNEEMHFEKYAPLPASVKGIIANRLAGAIEKDDVKEQALIHSGIVPLEEAIRMYVLKYAKTAKIKNIADTFVKKLESQKTFEKAITDIATNEQEKAKAAKNLEIIESKIKSGDEAKKFKEIINNVNYDAEINTRAEKIVQEAEDDVSEYFLGMVSDKMTKVEAKKTCEKLMKKASDVQAKMKAELETMVNGTIAENAAELLNQYKQKLADLVKEIDTVDSIPIDPFKMIEGDLSNLENFEEIIKSASHVEQVREIVGNHKEYKEVFGFRRWLNKKVGTNFNVKYEVIDDWDWVDREFIDGQILSDKFIVPIQLKLYEDKDCAVDFAKKGALAIQSAFSKQFDQLDELLTAKLEELKVCASDEKIAKKKLEEAEERLKWLEDIQSRIDSILDI